VGARDYSGGKGPGLDPDIADRARLAHVPRPLHRASWAGLDDARDDRSRAGRLSRARCRRVRAT
jgi:hypothetical protein